MKDIPVFTTENGVASLSMAELPYKKAVYVRVQDSRAPSAFLAECVDFCSALGAEKVFATGNGIADTYPVYATVCRMEARRSLLPATNARPIPVEEGNFEKWRTALNTRMADVPGASTVTADRKERLLAESCAYFVEDAGRLIGLGKVSGGQVEAVAALEKGVGRDVLLVLCSLVAGDTVKLEVAWENAPAVRLYQALGFTLTDILYRWYTLK